ncbi:MAG: AAA family ATPase, partial [Deltaproteobacteria bacterium]|nr:AAA family ATPase [Deltaproteobacteria bacterium]
MKIAKTTYSFYELRRKNCLYVDKTPYIEKLINRTDNLFFLQRPRRFGKSVFISTLLSLFKGESELFDNLALNGSNYDFKKYPTLKFSFTNLKWNSVNLLDLDLYKRILLVAESFGLSVENSADAPSTALIELVMKLKNKTGNQIVILVDEYDSPILDALENTDDAMNNAKALGGFFGTVKDLNQDGYLRFAFVTGVSKFSMTSIFSGANVFTDISENQEYANICGITFDEFDKYIKGHIQEKFEEGYFKTTKFKDIDDFIKALKDMYDGYTWNNVDKIFNPYSLLNAVESRELDSYWFDSGTPTVLYKYFKKNQKTSLFLDDVKMPRVYLKNQTAADLSLVPLLYQTGYLTSSLPVKDGVYTLKIPNIEVKNALNFLLTKTFVNEKLGDFYKFGVKLLTAFKKNDEKIIQKRLAALFSKIKLKRNEFCERTFHIALLFFIQFAGIKEVYSELNLGGGRIDICFMLDESKAILLELKSLDRSHFHKNDTELDVSFTE